jgi:hypothetical protein
MSRKIYLGWILGTMLCSGLSAENVGADQAGPDSGCGQKIRMRDVFVLDLESFRSHPEMAQGFVLERVGEFRLVKTEPEEIRTRSRPSRDPDSLIRRARKLGAKKGCDLVLVLKTGPYFGRQRNVRARIREQGYALVVMGHRIVGSETFQ